ncbi:MAG: hypothetical protein PGN13_05450 [Patulibacter minatonensis]
MAYLTQRARGRWELRESVSTDRGPRSRTLASFDRLTDDVLHQAAQRATRPFDEAAVRADARRKAVPFELPPAERAARELAGLLAHGATVTPAIAGILRDLLDASTPRPPSDAARAAAEWIGTTPEDRAAALEDLLLLADALPMPKRAERPDFPRLISTAGGRP